MVTLGIVTIGQAPRDDVVAELVPILPECRIVQCGALDGLTTAELASLRPGEGEERLVTRLADGGSVVIGGERVVPLMSGAVARAEDEGADLTLVVCSGSFPPLPHRRPLLFMETLAHHAVAALGTDVRVGVVRPLPEQLYDRAAWERSLGRPVSASAAASPYTDDLAAIGAAAAELADRCDVIVLDCVGYDERMRAVANAAAHRPVLLVRTLAARLTAELLLGQRGPSRYRDARTRGDEVR